MNFNMKISTYILALKKLLTPIFFSKGRIIKYRILSTCKKVFGLPVRNCPVLINGLGSISFGKNVNLGFADSPYFYNSYIYLEARNINSKIEIMSGVYLNNNACIICEGAEGIKIGANTLIGTSFTLYDSNFHDLDPFARFDGIPETAGVIIGENVFIGSNVTVLKGVEIGNNSIIGSGSIVSKTIPENVIAAGNPCRVIKPLQPKKQSI